MSSNFNREVMKLWCTEIVALDPKDKNFKRWCGPNVPGVNIQTAQEYCDNNGLGYCQVTGELIAEIPCKEGTYEADMDKIVDYEKPQLN